MLVHVHHTRELRASRAKKHFSTLNMPIESQDKSCLQLDAANARAWSVELTQRPRQRPQPPQSVPVAQLPQPHELYGTPAVPRGTAAAAAKGVDTQPRSSSSYVPVLTQS